MPYVRSLTDARPPARYDTDEPFVEVAIQEAPDDSGAPGVWTTIETIALADLDGGVDADPAAPAYRDLTTDAGTLEAGWLRVVWADADGSTATSPAVAFDDVTSSPDGAYCTAGQLRTELGLDSSTLTDAATNALIADACDVIDSELGAREINETTGRKVTQDDDDVLTWQWELLSRATVKAAAILHARPNVINGQQYDRVQGPDFEFWGRQGSPFGTLVGMLLDRSELRRLTTTTGRGDGRPPWYGFSYGVRED